MGSEIKLVTSKGIITYSVYDFINEIGKRPVIWDKEHVNRRNRFLAWHDVIRCFVPFFNELTSKEQNELFLEFSKLWKNKTNMLMKTIKIRQTEPNPPRLYRYTRHFEFYLNIRGITLDQVGTPEEFEEIDEIARESYEKLNATDIKEGNDKNTKTNNDVNGGTVSNKENINDRAFDPAELYESNTIQDVNANKMDYEEMEHNHVYDTMRFVNVENEFEDADQDFFDSLKPFLNKLNEEQMLDFKIDFLEILKKYRLQKV